MSRWVKFCLVLLCLPLTLGACSEPPPEKPSRGLNLLVAAADDVALQREGWSGAAPVGVGTVVGPTDLLETAHQAVVLCTDLTVGVVQGRQTPPCPREEGVLQRQGAAYQLRVRSGERDYPYIIYPRGTLVLEPQPSLHWHDTGAASYRVSVDEADSGKEVWSRSGVTGGEMTYPDDAPALEPGVNYFVEVVEEETGRSSDEETIPGRGFRVVSAEELAEIEEYRGRILEETRLEESARELVLAIYYATYPAQGGYGLAGEAWRLLEPLAGRPDMPRVHLWLGDTYFALQLGAEAEAAYQQVLERTSERGDIEAQAEARMGLWRVTEEENHYDEAVRLYESLGATARVGEIKSEREERE